MFHVEQSDQENTLVNAKDYLVSGEMFSVVLNPLTQIAKTTPAPSPQNMPNYYASENYISHGNKKTSLIEHIYAFAQTIMLFKKEKWLRKYSSTGKQYLDYGCGTGRFVQHLNKQGWEAFGYEPSDKARAVYKLKEVVSTTDQLKQREFDSVGLWHVLEHLTDPGKTLGDLYTQMASGAYLFVAVPNFKAFDAKRYGRFWAAYDVPRHLWHFSSEGINQLCHEAGFRLKRKRGMFLDAFYICYLSEKHRGRSFALLRGLFWGMISNLNGLHTGDYSAMLYVFTKKE